MGFLLVLDRIECAEIHIGFEHAKKKRSIEMLLWFNVMVAVNGGLW